MYDEFKRDKDGDFRGIFYAVFKRDEDEVFFMLNLNVINMAIFDKDCDFRGTFYDGFKRDKYGNFRFFLV